MNFFQPTHRRLTPPREMPPVATVTGSPGHPSEEDGRWAAIYALILFVPIAFVGIAVATVLLRRWQKKRRAARGVADTQADQNDTTHLHRHWFPWRYTAGTAVDGADRQATVTPAITSTSTTTIPAADMPVNQPEQPEQQQYQEEAPRLFGVNPQLARRLAARFESGGRGGSPLTSNNNHTNTTQSVVSQWPGPEAATSPYTGGGLQGTPEQGQTGAAARQQQVFCHGYGARRDSGVNREPQEGGFEMQPLRGGIQTENLDEVDLGDGAAVVNPNDEGQRAARRQYLRGLTRDDVEGPAGGERPQRHGLGKFFAS